MAKAVEETKLPIDPDFQNYCLEAGLEGRLTLPAGKRTSDPFKLTHLSKDMSPLPKFGLLDIFNHLIASEAQHDKGMLTSWRTSDEYKLHQNGHVRDLNRVMANDSAFYTNTERKPQKIDKHTASGSLLAPVGLFTLHFANVKLAQIKAVNIWGLLF